MIGRLVKPVVAIISSAKPVPRMAEKPPEGPVSGLSDKGRVVSYHMVDYYEARFLSRMVQITPEGCGPYGVDDGSMWKVAFFENRERKLKEEWEYRIDFDV